VKSILIKAIEDTDGEQLVRVLSLLTGWFFLIVAFYSIQKRNEYSDIWYFATGIPLLVIIGLWAGKRFALFIESMNEKLFLGLCVAIFIMLRIIWLVSVRSIPAADFATFDLLASMLSNYEPIDQPIAMQVLLPAWGYPLFLAGWYSLVGQSVFTGKLFNLLLGTASVPLIYILSRQIAGCLVARIATILFVFWPTQIMMTGVLASEHLAVFLAMVAFYFFFEEMKKHRWRNVLLGAVFLSLAFIVRHTLIAVLFASIFLLLFSNNTSKILKLKTVSALMISFLAVYAAYLLAMTMVYHVTPLSQGMFNLLVGTNIASGGHWNKEDAEKYFSHSTFIEANDYAQREVYKRIASNPKGIIKLMLHKSVLTWADGTYGFFCCTLKLDNNRLTANIVSHQGFLGGIAHYFHLMILLLCAAGCLKPFDHSDIMRYSAILFVILFGTALHSIFETQGRYSYVMFLFVLIIAAKGVCSLAALHPLARNASAFRKE
jgi:4-amino-4-deoxy-L-arabinose transferase-like glycosyltransferase